MKELAFLALITTCIAKDWHSFKVNYNRVYENHSEELMRRSVFERNRRWVDEHNKNYEQGLVSFKVKLNEFGDLTDEEFRKLYLNSNKSSLMQSHGLETISYIHSTAAGYPKSLNWTSLGAVTPVRDQGRCGSCWAFSAAGALEAQMFRKTRKLVPLSEQHLIDCSWRFGNNGCQGGMPYKALNYIHQYGVPPEESYPYIGEEGTCQINKNISNVKLKKIYALNRTGNREYILQAAVAQIGPISACIWASRSFRFFSEGIFYDNECIKNYEINHAVLVVGYGSENGTDYWLVKNSWGTKWGEYGYAKMARNMNDNCNIASHNVFPTV